MAGRTGIGGNSTDIIRSDSLPEKLVLLVASGSDVSSGALSASCMSCSISSKAMPDCESIGA